MILSIYSKIAIFENIRDNAIKHNEHQNILTTEDEHRSYEHQFMNISSFN